ncbi:MAG TPA: helix-turn-helix domain-containing protein, partial [Oceanipulchritudo sp.]|nr:helix-turn-helix domain-containing protein [Oceanipulchritudo sp.]
MKPPPFTPAFATVHHAEYECIRRMNYCWENARRTPVGTLVIQRTLRGEGILEDAEGIHPVPPDRAMIFVYGEVTTYRINRATGHPYEIHYTVLHPRGGIGELVARIREDFGSVLFMRAQGESAGILETLVEQFSESRTHDSLDLAERAYRLLIALYREQVLGTVGRDPVAYLRHTLHSQFRSPRNIKEWTHSMAMSREHLSRLFRKRYGESPAAYLRRLRLEQAHILARNRTMSAGDIARSC